jgi:hypothetical protein
MMRGHTRALLFSTAVLSAAACDPPDAQLGTSEETAEGEESEPSFREKDWWEVERCEITSNGSCPNFPGVTFPLNDTFQDAATNYKRCLTRANDYAAWCGTPAGTWIKATSYTAEGEALAANSWALDGCVVDLEACPNFPELAFATLADPAGTEAACMARALDFAVGCTPAQSTNVALASFFVGGVLTDARQAMNLCWNKSCKGKKSEKWPQSACFHQKKTPYSRYEVLEDPTGGNVAGAILRLDGSGNCGNDYVRAEVYAWLGIPRPTEVWIEREGQGAIPWTYASGMSSGPKPLYTVMAVAQGRMRACAKVAAGDGVGPAAGCTEWAPW